MSLHRYRHNGQQKQNNHHQAGRIKQSGFYCEQEAAFVADTQNLVIINHQDQHCEQNARIQRAAECEKHCEHSQKADLA